MGFGFWVLGLRFGLVAAAACDDFSLGFIQLPNPKLEPND